MVDKLVNYCEDKLNLKNVSLSNEYYYSSISNCLIDAIFSIGIKYSTTKIVVERFCQYINIDEFRDFGSNYLDVETQFSINDLIEFYKINGLDNITKEIYKNSCRTSTTNGILKSQAVLECAKVLQKYDINYFQDISKIQNNLKFEYDFKSIKGQSSGKSLSYFFMLIGNENLIKPDRMVKRFVYDCLEIDLSTEDLIEIFNDVIIELRKKHINLTLRKLDHEIWKYQRDKH